MIRATGPAGAVLSTWDAAEYRTVPLRAGAAVAPQPGAGGGAAIFTWRGDHLATGWLSAYTRQALA